MYPHPIPRHPFKAFVALVAMAAFVHGVFAQVVSRHAGGPRIEIVAHTHAHTPAACTSDDSACDCGDDDDPHVPDSILGETDDAEDS